MSPEPTVPHADPHPSSARRANAAFPSVQAVLFDMDRLPVDTETTRFVAARRVMGRLGGSWGPEDQAAVVGGPLEWCAAYMAARSGSPKSHQLISRWLNEEMISLLAHGADHRPGADNLLEALVVAGIACGLVSASHRALVDAVLASIGGHHFAVTVAGDEVARTKPFPDPYLEAARRLGVRPASCVVLEDSPVGVAAAEAAGCVVVAVPFVVPIPPATGRTVVSSLEAVTTAFLDDLVASRAETG